MATIKDATSAVVQLPGTRDLSGADTNFTKQWKWVNESKTGFQKFYRGGWSVVKTAGAGLAMILGLSVIFLPLSKAAYSFFFHKDLSALKQRIGIPDSDFNRTQLNRIFDIKKQAFKSDSVRIKNLNRVLTETEKSLSKDAHGTSKARGKEDRYFHAEGCKFVHETAGLNTSEIIAAKQDLIAAVQDVVKATDKYTLQQGNSASAISRRDYLVEGILKFAQGQGLSEQFVTSAVLERSANPNPHQLANQQCIRTLQEGVENGLLSTNDPELTFALEQIARVEMEKVEAANRAAGPDGTTNPDVIVGQLGVVFKEAGLLEDDNLMRFLYNVYHRDEATSHPRASRLKNDAGIASAVDAGTASSQVASGGQLEMPVGPDIEGSAPGTLPVNETPAQAKARLRAIATAEKARLSAIATAEADADLEVFLQTLKDLVDAQKVWIEHLVVLKNLLKIKSGDDLKNLSRQELLAVAQASRRLGLAVHPDKRKENLDQDILQKKSDIEAQIREVNRILDVIYKGRPEEEVTRYSVRPANFGQASKEKRSLANSLENQIINNRSRIAHEQKRIAQVEGAVQKVEAEIRLSAAKGIPFAFGQPDELELPEFKVAEEELVGPGEPETEKSGFFSRLLREKTTPAAEQAEELAVAASDDVALPDLAIAVGPEGSR